MSLYNHFFQKNPDADKILKKARFVCTGIRDVSIRDKQIIIYCLGQPSVEHVWHAKTEADSFNPSFSNVYLQIPDEMYNEFVGLSYGVSLPFERWKSLINAISEDETKVITSRLSVQLFHSDESKNWRPLNVRNN